MERTHRENIAKLLSRILMEASDKDIHTFLSSMSLSLMKMSSSAEDNSLKDRVASLVRSVYGDNSMQMIVTFTQEDTDSKNLKVDTKVLGMNPTQELYIATRYLRAALERRSVDETIIELDRGALRISSSLYIDSTNQNNDVGI